MNRSVLSKRISKEEITYLKNNTDALISFLNEQNDGVIVYLLEKFGRLENSHTKYALLNLLDNNNKAIRSLALKNLAKIKDISLLDTFVRLARNDDSTEVRRESVSAIGRLRNEATIPILTKLLSDQDPKVVMQALRGLLVFIDNNLVKNELSKLINHPNELIREIISKEINGVKDELKNSAKYNESPQYLKNTVVQGDVLEVLKHVPDESIHLTFTSPPYYNARDYSIYQSYDEYLKFLDEAFKEVYRVTKEGRFFILNTSPIIIPRISRAYSSKRYPIPYDIHPLLIKMGWEFIDDIIWLKPEASAKNRNAGFMQHRKPLGYKPNSVTEMLMVYRKKTVKLIDWNMRQYSKEKIEKSKVLGNYESSNVWRIDPTFDKVHSAVFPMELCNRIIKYYSFVDDLIFDPFAGSGTLGKAAMSLNRYFFLTEKEERYVKKMKQDINKNSDISTLSNIPISFVDIDQFVNIIKNDI